MDAKDGEKEKDQEEEYTNRTKEEAKPHKMDESSKKEEEYGEEKENCRTQKYGYQVAFRHPVLIIRFILSSIHIL